MKGKSGHTRPAGGSGVRRGNEGAPLLTRITTVFLFLLATVFLLWCGGGGYKAIDSAKFGAFLLLCGGYVVLMLAVAGECLLTGDLTLPAVQELRGFFRLPQIFAIAYLAITWVSALLSSWFPETVLGVSRHEGAVTITLYVAVFLLVSWFGRPSPVLLAGLGVSTLLFCLLSLVQLAGWNPFFLYPKGMNYYGAFVDYSGAYLGTIGNVDLVAAFLCLVIPLLWIGVLRLRGTQRFYLLAPLVLALLVLGKMSVMAGLVGVLAGGLLCVPVVAPLERKYRVRTGVGIIALACLAVVCLWLVDPGSGTLHEIHEVLHGNFDETFGSSRLHIWKEVLDRVPSQLLLGSGPDTMLRGGLEAFQRYHEASDQLLVAQIDAAHNEYLNVLYHQGAVAFLAWLGLLGSLATDWIRKGGTDPAVGMLGGAALCYCVQAFFGISMCITAPFFWAILGLLDGCCRRKEGKAGLVVRK